MTVWFLKILNMSITASVVIVFVLAARFILRKLPKVFSYILWSVVLFRLICPFSFTLPFSLLELTNPKSVENGMVVYVPTDIVNMGELNTNTDTAGVFSEDKKQDVKQDSGEFFQENGRMAQVSMKTAVSVMAYVWLFGILAMTGYSIVSLIQLKRRLVGAVRYNGNIRISDYVRTSFVLGIVRPDIYLWAGLSDAEREFVIMHEKTHIRRCDHLVKALFYLVLTVHWFNPLVWLSYFLCMKDMEMSCDESVMKKMNRDVRADYSETLLSLAAGRRIFAGTPIFFGGGDTKSRIKNILSYKKPAAWVITAGIISVAVLCIGFMGNPSKHFDDSEDNPVPAADGSYDYPQYPVYVRTMGDGSIGCEYGYCAVTDRDDDRILADLSQMKGFYFSNYYREDIALFYTGTPQEIKLYHTLAGNTDYEEYAFAGEGYQYPFGAENVKYVIQVPKDYGMHYFFAVISWEDGSEDLMYFSMEHKYNPPSDTEYNMVKVKNTKTGEMEVTYPDLYFPSYTMDGFTVRLTLPQGWSLEKRELAAADIAGLDPKEIIGTFLTTYIFDEDGICVGKMGCNYYELYEGAEDNPQAIYNQVALGNHYQFYVSNSYEIIKSSDIIETGTADVLYMEPANDGGNIRTNYGILSRSRKSMVYVALELESGPVSKEDVAVMAESIAFGE